jgi:hypothetical protein
MGSILTIIGPPVALVLLILGLLFADSSMRGWRRIAARFATDRPIDGANRQDGNVGGTAIIQLRGLLRAAATGRGLYIAPPRIMQLTHRPLLVPWEHVTLREEQTRLGVPILTLSIGRVHLGFVTLRGGVAGDVLERLNAPS